MYLMVIVGGAGNVKDGRLYEKGASSQNPDGPYRSGCLY